jgi:hypothetical protein
MLNITVKMAGHVACMGVIRNRILSENLYRPLKFTWEETTAMDLQEI